MAADGATPGSIQLAELIDEFGPALYADFTFAGLDLRDVLRPGSGLPPRRALNIIDHLPDNGNFAAVARFAMFRDPQKYAAPEALTWRDFRGWGVDREFMAALLDSIQAFHVSYGSVHAGKGKQKPTFKPMDRPGDRYRRTDAMFNKIFALGQRGG